MMKKLIVILLLFLSTSCAMTSVGDGVFDEREKAYFKLSVGIILSTKVEVVYPMYLITTIALSTPGDDVDGVFNNALEMVNINPELRPSVVDLIELIKVDMKNIVKVEGEKQEIIEEMLLLVNAACKERMR